MQVVTPTLQHAVMIEAVENHMPEVIIIDEIGTEQEASAARTIAERGVQLIATAHGNNLDNLILNPTLSDLIGGIQTVTLGDDEARRRRSQKSVLERKSLPTFDVVVEIQSWNRVAVHNDVAKVVDSILRGLHPAPEIRWTNEHGDVHKSRENRSNVVSMEVAEATELSSPATFPITRILPFGVNKGRVDQIIQNTKMPIQVVDNLDRAEILLTTKQFFRKMPKLLQSAEEVGKSIFVLRRNTLSQIRDFLRDVSRQKGWEDPVDLAVREAENAAREVYSGHGTVALTPQAAYIRRLQHQIAQELSLTSVSVGRDPNRRVTISRE